MISQDHRRKLGNNVKGAAQFKVAGDWGLVGRWGGLQATRSGEGTSRVESDEAYSVGPVREPLCVRQGEGVGVSDVLGVTNAQAREQYWSLHSAGGTHRYKKRIRDGKMAVKDYRNKLNKSAA
ncbi:hypothetical protein ON010_g10955 [Phytophthora cinnamomi]|nr:hypothetical protein ON010_g10955 [Phytophthora cinnamomi]